MRWRHKVPAELVDQIARGDGVLVVGPGLARSVGLPSTRKMLRELASSLDRCPPDADALDVAQYYEYDFGRNQLIRQLREQVDSFTAEPGRLLEALARIPFSRLVTTGFDDLVEQALRLASRRYVSVPDAAEFPYGTRSQLQLVKLFGDFDHPESLVITTRDRERYTVNHLGLSQLVELTLQTRAVLFIGFAPDDPDLRFVLNQARNDLGRGSPSLFSVHADALPLQIKDLESRGVRVLNLAAPGTRSAVGPYLGWVEELGRQTVAKAAALSTATSDGGQPLRLADQVVGLLESMGWSVVPGSITSGYSDFLVEGQDGGVRTRRRIRCIEGRITSDDVQSMAELVESEPDAEGWLITYRRGIVTPQARAECERHERVRVLSVAEFYRTALNLDAYLRRVLQKHLDTSVDRYWVDLACEVPQQRRPDRASSRRDAFDSVEAFLDAWIDTPGRNHVSILGDFGMGKSWLCRHYTAVLARKYLEDCEHNRVPILISLRNLARTPNLREMITDTLVNEYQINLPGGYRTFDFLNRHDSLVLIFDGFDEMAVELDARRAEENFEELAKIVLPDANCKVILTCRTSYFRTDIEERGFLAGEGIQRIRIRDRPNFEILNLLPLDTPRVEQALRLLVPQEWESYSQQIQQTYDLPDLAQRPILLSMIAATLPRLVRIPHVTPAALYQTYTDDWVRKNIAEQRTFMDAERKAFFMQELAWEMWQRGRLSIHYTEFPHRVRTHFGISDESTVDFFEHDIRTQSFLERDVLGFYSFAHKSFMEFFIAQKMFARIAADDSAYLAEAQTSHETDQFIKDFLIREPVYVQRLLAWMGDEQRALLGVNAAGIIAKIGDPELTEQVVELLRVSPRTRHLYLTAVIFRVLEIQWEAAARLAEEDSDESPNLIRLPAAQLPKVIEKFSSEAGNPRDGVARWLSVSLLAHVQDVSPDMVGRALAQALTRERTPSTVTLIQQVLEHIERDLR